MPSIPEESNTTTEIQTIETGHEAKSLSVKTTTTATTELTPTQLYIEGTAITNDTQLAFQEHKVQQLISKQIDLEYGVSDLLTIITLIIALGSMMISMVANRIPTIKQGDIGIIAIAVTILLGSLGYGVYGECKKRSDRKIIQMQIINTINAIDTYNINKENKPCKN